VSLEVLDGTLLSLDFWRQQSRVEMLVDVVADVVLLEAEQFILVNPDQLVAKPW